jgi:hypothetical protein
MIRKIVTALVLVPLAMVFVALAVANRQPVLVSFDPFDQLNPAFARALPLYALMLILVIAGVVVGGIAAWVRQAKWRRAARLADAQARELRAEVERLRRMGPAEVIVGPRPLSTRPVPPDYGPRLSIPPPAA